MATTKKKPAAKARKKSASKKDASSQATKAPRKRSRRSTASKGTTKKTAPKSSSASSEETSSKSSPQKKSGRKGRARSKSRRAVLVAGVRTPFVRAFGSFMELDTIDLGVAAVDGLLKKAQVGVEHIDALVWGGVILPPHAPNVGREIVLDLHLPARVEAMTVTRACTSGLQAITLAVSAIERGDADVVIAGGSDSTSNASVTLPPEAVHALAPVAFGKVKGPGAMLQTAKKLFPPSKVLPRMPRIAERTTGEVMGESAEKMAQRWGVSREAQDAFALRSHRRAAAAIESGRFDDEIVPVDVGGRRIEKDDIVRGDSSMEKLGKLRPAFAKDGTISAGNASALTDGAAATLWMSEEKAAELGLQPLAVLRSWSFVGVDPRDQLLIGPAIAMPEALARAGLTMKDIQLTDLHEAFAGQVLSVVEALKSEPFMEERLDDSARATFEGWQGFELDATGEADDAPLNVHGGSVALGHPFAATGARMVTTMANELGGDVKRVLLGICAAGGLGAAAVLEAP